MENLKYILFVSILCFSFRSVFADVSSDVVTINRECVVAFDNMKSKKEDFCKCYANNLTRLLISPTQVPAIVEWLKNQMSDQDQTRNEPLIDMEYQVTSECAKDPNWIAPKILEMSQKASKKK